MLAFYVDSSACKNIPVRPETNFARPEATRDFILKGTNGPEDGDGGDEERKSLPLTATDDSEAAGERCFSECGSGFLSLF